MTVVFKLGGSLLTQEGLAQNLQIALRQRQDDPCLIIPGGGAAADVVRGWSRTHHLDSETAHWLALSSIDLNCQLIEKLLNLRAVGARNVARNHWCDDRSPLILNLREFVAAEESSGAKSLPHDWSVTSDSLAAWTALRWPAHELVLLKSLPAPIGMTAQEASDQGMVDEFFPLIANDLRGISWCNVRAPEIVIEPWLSSVVDFSEESDNGS